MEFVCDVKSGVLQGCPLASILFILAMEPFVQMFIKSIDSQGIGHTCLCADDIAIVLQSWRDLVKAYQVFALAAAAAGLHLKFKKRDTTIKRTTSSS